MMKKWLFLLCLCVSGDALAVMIRGRVDIALQYGVMPMQGAMVMICNQGGGCMNYVTGPDGMYYFDAPLGPQIIVVNGVQRAPLTVFMAPYIDVPPIIVVNR